MAESKADMDAHLKTAGLPVEYKNKANVTDQLSPAVSDTFNQLKVRRKHRYIVYKIMDESIDVEHIGERSEGFAGLAAKLPYSECRYAIYEHEWKTHDGRQVSKIWFISWFPNNSTPYDKMAYTTAKKYLREFLDGVYDVQSSTTDELEIAMFGPKEEEEESDEDF